jgi:protein-disulfide isomerase
LENDGKVYVVIGKHILYNGTGIRYTTRMSEFKKLELTPSVSIIIAGIIVAGAIVFTNYNHPQAQTAVAAQAAGVVAAASAQVPPPSASDHLIGSPTAPIVLIEYSDFQCPYCSMIYPTLKKIVSESNGQVAWAYREFPLYQIHPQAMPAANAAECIAAQLGNTGFWQYADTIFGDQSKLTPAYSAQLAKQFGADPAKYAACIAASTYQSKIDADTAEAEAAGGQGTPFTVIVNTKTGKQTPVSGALPYAQLVAAINAAK